MEIRMRFLALFLTFSLFFNIPLSANPAPSNPGIFSKAKELAGKAIAYAKKGGKFLLSPDGQILIIVAYGTTYLIKGLYDFAQITRQANPVPLSSLPSAVQEAVAGMNPQKQISFKFGGDLVAASTPKTIILGEEFFSHTPEMQKFIVGHELAHIQNDHPLKGVLAYFGLYSSAFTSWFAAVLAWDLAVKNAKNKKNGLKNKCIVAAKKAINFIAENPIIPFAIMMTLGSRFSQHLEKEADMESATKLQCAQAGIDFFNFYRISAKNTATTSFWNHVNPINISNKISDLFGWTRHPSRSQRIEYLKPLAEYQNG